MVHHTEPHMKLQCAPWATTPYHPQPIPTSPSKKGIPSATNSPNSEPGAILISFWSSCPTPFSSTKEQGQSALPCHTWKADGHRQMSRVTTWLRFNNESLHLPENFLVWANKANQSQDLQCRRAASVAPRTRKEQKCRHRLGLRVLGIRLDCKMSVFTTAGCSRTSHDILINNSIYGGGL